MCVCMLTCVFAWTDYVQEMLQSCAMYNRRRSLGHTDESCNVALAKTVWVSVQLSSCIACFTFVVTVHSVNIIGAAMCGIAQFGKLLGIVVPLESNIQDPCISKCPESYSLRVHEEIYLITQVSVQYCNYCMSGRGIFTSQKCSLIYVIKLLSITTTVACLFSHKICFEYAYYNFNRAHKNGRLE